MQSTIYFSKKRAIRRISTYFFTKKGL